MNGAVIIHDFELAYMGHTSEEVEAEIDSGRFGMAEDTGRLLNSAIAEGWGTGKRYWRIYWTVHVTPSPSIPQSEIESLKRQVRNWESP